MSSYQYEFAFVVDNRVVRVCQGDATGYELWQKSTVALEWQQKSPLARRVTFWAHPGLKRVRLEPGEVMESIRELGVRDHSYFDALERQADEI